MLEAGWERGIGWGRSEAGWGRAEAGWEWGSWVG